LAGSSAFILENRDKPRGQPVISGADIACSIAFGLQDAA
jgi:hypothetical protein